MTLHAHSLLTILLYAMHESLLGTALMTNNISTGAAMVLGEKDPVEFAVAYHAVRHVGVLHPSDPLESVLVLTEGSSEHHLLTVDDGVFLSAARCICEVVFISTN